MAETSRANLERRYRWRLLRAGPILLDGGGMFGIVPRVLWSKLVVPDAQGRIPLTHNCLLLEAVDKSEKILIEAGSGNKFDPRTRAIYGLTDRCVLDAVQEADCDPADIHHTIVTHLHFDHAGGLTRLANETEAADWISPSGMRIVRSFPNAAVHVQRREWEDAIINRSVMTRTYLPENLFPLEDHLELHESPRAFDHLPRRDEDPPQRATTRQTQILPGIFALLVPGHTWGQQAIGFTDDRGRTVVFTPDVMPTVHHVGAAYNLGYDVEPYISTVTRRWFLREAADNDWLLVLDHEPGNPLQRVRADGKGWYTLIPQPQDRS
jgi:glyoxylase-like metal-dependent hydrolase (beta-lactamase superfamily II)